ncbi:hypothetical protein WA026_012876 [Henosepilachna vigintioctopunctata]|uniref:Reverse transcriptase domain-containing protein n=1 Tax=Henosepilachna vigintioctopunctata TaxID=420089 RepID=A0AAW1TUL1_9CUCU
MIRNEKKLFYENNIDLVKGDAKSMWKTLKKLITAKSDERTCREIIYNGQMYTDPTKIPDIFNGYFIDSIQQLVNSINTPQSTITETAQPRQIKIKWRTFKLLDINKLKEMIMTLPNKSSPNEVNMSMLKECFESVSNPLINVINCSLETGVIPSKLKVTTIVPIKKVLNTKLIEEYRPINTMSSEAKILEKVVCEQLIQHLDINNILIEQQSGYRHKHNAESALQYVIEQWKHNLDRDQSTIVVFLDLKRAFETIDRNRLNKKLREYGVEGTVLEWFRNYLQNRKQVVKCGNFVSNELENSIGIPQGTILGPMLFNMYINDLGYNLKYCGYHLFADDTVLFITGCSLDIVDKLQDDLNLLVEWLKINKLKLNASKTKIMVVEKKPLIGNVINVTLDGEKIEIVSSIKYLGVMLDSRLELKEHINYVCRKISKKIGFLSRCSRFLSQWTKQTVYNTIILPHFNYASTVLYLANKSDVNRLQILQNRAMRIILGCDRYTSIQTMLTRLNWVDIASYLEINSLKFIHKIRLKLLPDYCINMLSYFKDIHDHNTRNRENFILDHKNKKSTQNSVFFKAVNIYNKLPNNLKECRKMAEFNSKIKRHYQKKD